MNVGIGGQMFRRYIGVDYSGAGLPTRANGGLAACAVDNQGNEEFLDRDNGTNWSRSTLADRIIQEVHQEGRGEYIPILVGIDHAFSFPDCYFQRFPQETWDVFLDDFQEHWQTDAPGVTVRDGYSEQLRRMMRRNGETYRFGLPDWRRATENIEGFTPSGVFDFLVKQGDVAHSTHAGLPWLRHIRRELGDDLERVHFWPFDRWDIPQGHSAVVEVYPALLRPRLCGPLRGRDGHQQDAYCVARWMYECDQRGDLDEFFAPGLNDREGNLARREGWIFGLRR